MSGFYTNYILGYLNDAARPHQLLRIELVDPLCPVNKMVGGIDMGRRVHTHCYLGHICSRSGSYRFKGTDLDPRIAFIDRCLCRDGVSNVVYFHFALSNSTTAGFSLMVMGAPAF